MMYFRFFKTNIYNNFRFHPKSLIIEDSNTQPFQINSIFWVVNKYKYQEYIKPLEKHLEKIIDHPEIHFWKIHDVIEFFLKIDPDFVNRLLKEKGKTLKDFNFQN